MEKRDTKFRFKLRMKLDSWGSYKKDDIDFFYISLLDENNGLLHFPIELDKWEVISCDTYSGLNDMDGNEIYLSDIIKNSFGYYVVESNDGCFWACNVDEEDNVPLYVHNESSTIVSNLHIESRKLYIL